ncbi:alpha/beta fold hydrolase [Nocardia pseudobrasiliensis]|uniref:Pimeloyl-ACP methyl ester carboxylesterase n=1 Tax=Nocardia pseudobrasiliensis TaxID=45979 RepID=A0A370HZH8_9NOCA|nr:alpha/beta hydrolase [Nocardia pseudobrasiliensis]RDI63889.1 pimeloyl-ACP methyl ester carboxylesterase [Nocardia pseudobrasiliensis]
MASTGTALEPPRIEGVRRSTVTARGVRFHVTEAGPADGRPVVALHGWPQHHYTYRHLLADPPEGLRVIAPDLPGYGWSGPPPHRWLKDEIASDVLALLDSLELPRALLIGHDWGGYVGFLMALREPERFSGFIPLNIAHPWQSPRTFAPHAWRFLLYQPLVAGLGMPLQQRTPFLTQVFQRGVTNHAEFSPEVIRAYTERFRDPITARAATDTYRTFLLREVPALGRTRSPRATLPIRALFGKNDSAIHHALASAETADADDYTIEYVSGCGHFIPEERPDLVRRKLLDLAAETA